jgi:ubiquitin-activating enzyme E1
MSVSWGEWMGSWKVGAEVDHEAERIDRQKAAFGGDTVARMKDLNVLIVGCKGVGVETAKNLILSNVGGVVLYDNEICSAADRGTNFFVTDDDVAAGTNRADASLPELRSLNPFCRVDVYNSPNGITDKHLLNPDVLGTGRPFAAIVVSKLIPRHDLVRLNEVARANGIAFILAINHGVTSSIFSDFGPHHEILDATGEPTQTLAVSNMEIVEKSTLLDIPGVKDGEKVVIVTVAQTEHGLDDGDMGVFDDMRDALAGLNGKMVKVKRVAISSPTEANVDSSGVVFTEALKLPTSEVVSNFQRQFDFYKAEFDKEQDPKKKFPVRTITLFNRLALVLDDEFLSEVGVSLDVFASYQAGGLLNQVRLPAIKEYRSLAETLEQTVVPQMLRGEEWEAGKGVEIHLSIAAVLEFYRTEERWPGIHDKVDAQKVVDLAKGISNKRKGRDGACWAQEVAFGFPSGETRDLDEERVARFARLFQTELTGFCAFLGGAAAQEVIKASGKFTPIDQWVHHDEPFLVADECPSNVGPLFGSRYDHQIAIMGKDFQARAANQRIFLVGCGALGCEYLKGLELMGVGTGHDGKVWVTDMDTIEVSNLSRQFLFRQHDVGSAKSVSGARVVKKWNPQMNIEALEKKVGLDSEDFFDDKFWESLDVCWNALDNVHARQYTDSRCLFYSKPLLESGTLGTKSNSEVVLPFRTSTYNDGEETDDNENQIAMCTLRSFPYLPKHCIEFAKQSYFSDYFEFGPDQFETFRKDTSTYFEQLDSMEAGEQLKSLRMIMFFVDLQNEAGGKIDFDACVRIAFNRMIDDFRTSILNLCYSADEMEKNSDKKFWTGTKRRPSPVDWTDPITELMEYLYCTSNIYANVWGVENVRDRAKFVAIVDQLGLKQPEWTPSTENVDLSEGEEEKTGDGDAEEAEKLKDGLYSVDASALQPANPQDFEKDDDLNFHIDFLTVATNLRSWNYDIKNTPRHTVKVTAGRIIPALATTTAMVCGLVDIEFCKLVLGLQTHGREKFLNCNINLAAGSNNFTTFSPDPPVPISTGLKAPQPETFTSWDKIEIACGSRELSVEQLVEYIERSFHVSVDRIFQFGSTDNKALYNAVDKKKLEWDIAIGDDGKALVSDGVFTQWPQIRMAATMLSRLAPTSGQRKMFVMQVENVKKALDQTKMFFRNNFEGPVSVAFRNAYRPDEEGEKQEYFDSVFGARDYISVGVHCRTHDEEDVTLPCIKYCFAKE